MLLSKEERFIRKVLRKLAKQRVSSIHQPTGYWIIDNPIEENREVEVALHTCHLRGWVEIMVNAVPKGKLENGNLPQIEGIGPVYKLTDSGWQVINRSQSLLLISILIAILALIATVAGLDLWCK